MHAWLYILQVVEKNELLQEKERELDEKEEEISQLTQEVREKYISQ